MKTLDAVDTCTVRLARSVSGPQRRDRCKRALDLEVAIVGGRELELDAFEAAVPVRVLLLLVALRLTDDEGESIGLAAARCNAGTLLDLVELVAALAFDFALPETLRLASVFAAGPSRRLDDDRSRSSSSSPLRSRPCRSTALLVDVLSRRSCWYCSCCCCVCGKWERLALPLGAASRISSQRRV